MADLVLLLVMALGNVVAVLLPYFRKISEGKVKSFDFVYAKHLLGGVIGQFIVTVPLLSMWTSPDGFTDTFSAYLLAFFFGFGGNKVQMDVQKYISFLRTPTATLSST